MAVASETMHRLNGHLRCVVSTTQIANPKLFSAMRFVAIVFFPDRFIDMARGNSSPCHPDLTADSFE
jgi:hypothetical protein